MTELIVHNVPGRKTRLQVVRDRQTGEYSVTMEVPVKDEAEGNRVFEALIKVFQMK